MKRKSILALISSAIIIFSISLVGCGNNSAGTNKAGDDVTTKEDIKNTADAVKDNAEAAGDSLKYTAMNLKDDIVKAGYSVTDPTADSKKDYFKGSETDYMMGNDVIRVYEYTSAADLEGDINRIAPNGLTINGTKANYTRKPYYYRKGNSLIVYEGNEPAYVDEFKTMYGNPVIP